MSPPAAPLRWREVYLGTGWLILRTCLLGRALDLLLSALGRGEEPVLLNALYFLLGYFVTAFLFRGLLGDSLKKLPENPGRLLRGLLLGFCLYEFCQVGLGMLYEACFPAFQAPNDQNLQSLAGTGFWVLAAGSVLLSPLTEETLIRGLVFGALRDRSRVLAYVASALVFGFMHIAAYLGSASPGDLLMSLPLYVLPGLALAACYDFSGNIWAPILLHALINLMGVWGMRN